MKAWQCTTYEDPIRLELVERPLDAPKPTEIQIGMRAASVNFGETLILKGRYQLRPPLPYVPSSEMAGIVTDIGSNVTGFRRGDKVLALSFGQAGGAMQEVATFDQSSVFPLPPPLTFAEGAALPSNYYTVYDALRRRAQAKAGENLVVFGATGGIGVAAVQLGKIFGMKVIAVGGDDERLAALRTIGADEVINYRTASLREAIKDLTAGRGADVFLDPVGGDMFDAAMRAIAPGGRILVVGFTSGRFAAAATNIVLVKMISVIGVEGRLAIETTETGMADFHEMLAMAGRGEIVPPIGASYHFSQVPEAFERLGVRDVVGKIVVENPEEA